MWTFLLAFCPSTASPLTHWSTSTPSTPHSLNLSYLGLGYTGPVLVPQCSWCELSVERLLLAEKLSPCWTDSSVSTCLSLSLRNTFSDSWIQSVSLWNSFKWILGNFFLSQSFKDGNWDYSRILFSSVSNQSFPMNSRMLLFSLVFFLSFLSQISMKCYPVFLNHWTLSVSVAS